MSDSEQPDWVIYAETTHRYQSRAMRPGRMLAPAPLIEPHSGSHAVVPGSQVALCGVSIDGLYDYSDRLFRHVNPSLRCRECNEIAGSPTSLS